MNSTRVRKSRRKIQPATEPASVVSSRHQLIVAGRKKHIFVQGESCTRFGLELEFSRAREALQILGIDLDDRMPIVLYVRQSDFIVLVVLSFDADGERLQLHVQVFGDENRAF